MGRGFCILLLVLSLCACGARSDLPESESVPSRTEWNQPEEASSGQMADDLTDKAAAADEPSAPGIPESEEAAQSPTVPSGTQTVQPGAEVHAAAQTAPEQGAGDALPEKTETAVPGTERSEEETPAETMGEETIASSKEASILNIKVGDQTLLAVWEEHSSAEAFRELLAQGPLTVEMEDYGGFEKVGDLGPTLPRNDARITTQPGDVILYQGNQITIYYGTNTWNFTRLARIADPGSLQEALGEGTVSVTFSLA